jgi:hypothetical protein
MKRPTRNQLRNAFDACLFVCLMLAVGFDLLAEERQNRRIARAEKHIAKQDSLLRLQAQIIDAARAGRLQAIPSDTLYTYQP